MRFPYLYLLSFCGLLTSCLPTEEVCDEVRFGDEENEWFEAWKQIDSMVLKSETGDYDTLKLETMWKDGVEIRQGDSYCYTRYDNAVVTFRGRNNFLFWLEILPGYWEFKAVNPVFGFGYHGTESNVVYDSIGLVVKIIDSINIQNVLYRNVIMGFRYNIISNDTFNIFM